MMPASHLMLRLPRHSPQFKTFSQVTRPSISAFSASRALLDAANDELKYNHAELQARFDSRESREDDLQHIAGLQQDVQYLSSQCAGLECEAKQQSLRLENRNTNDAVFGRAMRITVCVERLFVERSVCGTVCVWNSSCVERFAC